MIRLDTIKLILTVISGICWTIVYIESIRIGFRDKSYAIPFFALALNITWELLYTIFGFRTEGLSTQNVFNAIWFTFDIGILYTYFKFGRKYFTQPSIETSAATAVASERTFIGWSLLVLLTAFGIEYSFIREFGVAHGAGYSAFLQNLLMSILFIAMLVRRGNREGQSLTIAISKWIGTLAPTILFGVLGEGGFPHGSILILTAGIFCSVFDLMYVRLLWKWK